MVSVNLESTIIHNFEFTFNAINNHWSYSIYDSDENPLLTGLRLSTNIDLIENFRYRLRLDGQLWCIWNDKRHAEIGEHDLYNGNASLIYLLEGEL